FGIVLLQLLSGKSPHVDPKTHIRKWAMKLVEAYEVDELRDSKMPAASEEAIVDFADLALDCIKSPGTRRPTMKDVAYRLSALIAKHCPDREDEWESAVREESEGNEGMSSRDVSSTSFEDSGRESGRARVELEGAVEVEVEAAGGVGVAAGAVLVVVVVAAAAETVVVVAAAVGVAAAEVEAAEVEAVEAVEAAAEEQEVVQGAELVGVVPSSAAAVVVAASGQVLAAASRTFL
ncbi:unnamed protein product, partial [Closterium sp. NIES-65]